MAEQESLWTAESAEKHDRWASWASWLVYRPFARRVARTLDAPLQELQVVDVGAGSGLLAIELAKVLPRARIIGIDISPQMLELGRKRALVSGLCRYLTRIGQAEDLPLDSACADLVVSQFSFHEWSDPQKGLLEALRVLKAGGSLFLRDFNRGRLSSLLAASDHGKMFRFSFRTVELFLREAGFASVRTLTRGVLVYTLQAVKA